MLYNARKKPGNGYMITKFTDDLDVEATYSTTVTHCNCPGGHRYNCRHRQMLEHFIATQRVGTGWMYDYDNERWYYYDHEQGRMLDAEPVRRPKVVKDASQWPSWRRIV